jgi:hypothetical protein
MHSEGTGITAYPLILCAKSDLDHALHLTPAAIFDSRTS